MEKTLFRFIWRFSAREQIIILLITVLSFPVLYYSLEIPKLIVNDAISIHEFPRFYLGLSLDQVPYLLALCFAFLAMVIINNGIKYVLNIFKGVTGERMLRRLRYELYERMMRFKPTRIRKISSGEIIPIITSESEPLGGFVGEAIATPAYWGGTLMVYIVFIFVQDPFLGAAAITLYPIQAYLIPKLQKRVVRLNRMRAKNIRALSSDIGESITAINDVHTGGGSRLYLLTISDKLYQNFRIRYEIYKRKFLIKFINNFINQLTPFFFYSIGGYMVIKGQVSLGALVAVLAAYKDLAGPWKELLNYYQQMSDVVVRYETVIDNFDHEEITERERIVPGQDTGERLTGDVVAERINLPEDIGTDAVTNFSCRIGTAETVALVGTERSGRSLILKTLGGVNEPTSGKVTFGGRSLGEVPETILARSIAYLTHAPHVFSGTLRANLLYGFGIVEPDMVFTAGVGDQTPKARLSEAKITNSAHPDLIGYNTLSDVERDALEGRALELLETFDLGDDVYQMGLNRPIGADAPDDFRDKILAVRGEIISTIEGDPKLSDLVHLWRIDEFNPSASLGENVFFALPSEPGDDFNKVAAERSALDALQKAGLLDDLVSLGAEIALATIDLFADVSGDNQLLSQYAFMPIEEFDDYASIAKRAQNTGASKLRPANQSELLALTLAFSPLRHRIVSIEDDLMDRIVKGRPKMRSFVDSSPLLDPIERTHILPALSIAGNLVFGRRRPDRRSNRQMLDELVRDKASSSGLKDLIARSGLVFDVGTAGGNLSPAQRQRVGIVRALMRDPTLVICDGLVANGTAEDRDLVDKVRKTMPGSALVVGTADATYGADIGRVIDVQGISGNMKPVTEKNNEP